VIDDVNLGIKDKDVERCIEEASIGGGYIEMKSGA